MCLQLLKNKVVQKDRRESTMPEEKFVPGIDPGLRAWLHMRHVMKELKTQNRNFIMIPSDIGFKHERYWIETMLDNLDPSQNRRQESRMTLHEFRTMISSKGCVPTSVMLYKGLHQRNMLFLRMLTENNFNVNGRADRLGRTMLHMASMNGYLEKVEYLINEGKAQINVIDDNNETPLMLAMVQSSQFHPIEIVKILLANGAKVNHQNNMGRTALHLGECYVQNYS